MKSLGDLWEGLVFASSEDKDSRRGSSRKAAKTTKNSPMWQERFAYRFQQLMRPPNTRNLKKSTPRHFLAGGKAFTA